MLSSEAVYTSRNCNSRVVFISLKAANCATTIQGAVSIRRNVVVARYMQALASSPGPKISCFTILTKQNFNSCYTYTLCCDLSLCITL